MTLYHVGCGIQFDHLPMGHFLTSAIRQNNRRIAERLAWRERYLQGIATAETMDRLERCDSAIKRLRASNAELLDELDELYNGDPVAQRSREDDEGAVMADNDWDGLS